jgi:hypothetical protein
MQPVVFGPLFNRQSQINNRQSYITIENALPPSKAARAQSILLNKSLVSG